MLVLAIFAFMFTLTWAFHVVAGFIFKDIVISPYAVAGGMMETFGPDLAWWATLGLILACLGVLEVTVTTIRQRLSGRASSSSSKTKGGGGGGGGSSSTEEGVRLAEMGTQVWKELERDPRFKPQLEAMYKDAI